MNNSFNIDSINIVDEAINHGIIDLARVQEKMEEMKKQEYLKMHPYKINLGKDGFWHTYLPLGNGKRKAVKRKYEDDIDKIVIDFWKQNTTTTFKKRYFEWVERQITQYQYMNRIILDSLKVIKLKIWILEILTKLLYLNSYKDYYQNKKSLTEHYRL